MEDEGYILKFNQYEGFSIYTIDEEGNTALVMSPRHSVDEALRNFAVVSGRSFAIPIVEIKR